MLRKRLIFGLIYNDGNFMQSRNFRLQKVGDISWLENNYKFQTQSFALDELLVLNASRNKKDIYEFSKTVARLVEGVFIPLSAGGGIRCLADVDALFLSGADKVVLNTALWENPDLAADIIAIYGEQSLVACVDYKLIDGVATVFIRDGSQALNLGLAEYLDYLQQLGVGEIILNSIDRDGSGFGFDLATADDLAPVIRIPLILMGGAGNEKHLYEGLTRDYVSAVATANLFNFIGDSLVNARKHALIAGSNLAIWPKDK